VQPSLSPVSKTRAISFRRGEETKLVKIFASFYTLTDENPMTKDRGKHNYEKTFSVKSLLRSTFKFNSLYKESFLLSLCPVSGVYYADQKSA
jgi:hypothetical protein